MEGEDGSAHSIGKFDGTDYAFRKMQIEDYLYGKKLHQPLSKKPEKMDQDEWELLDRQVLGVISWEPMRAAVSNFVSTQKLKFNDVRDRILAEEVRRIDSREKASRALLSTWKIETQIEITRVMADRSQGMDGVSPNSDSLQSAGIVERQVTLRRIAEHHRRRKTTLEAEPMQ
uniref:Uncharacterized protein n=1 Tax=Brassica oleracea var. oleracea TaxID=109376 RepID=A0A0D3E242_BRAOL